jgi:hypothetical protein
MEFKAISGKFKGVGNLMEDKLSKPRTSLSKVEILHQRAFPVVRRDGSASTATAQNKATGELGFEPSAKVGSFRGNLKICKGTTQWIPQ